MSEFNLTDSVQWCYLFKMPMHRSKELGEMNHRELAGLHIQGAAIAVLCFEQRSKAAPQVFVPESVEFCSIDSFWKYAKKLERRVRSGTVKALVFKCRKLRKAKVPSLIEISELDQVPLDTQLREYTGDGFGLLSFHNEDDETTLTPAGVIVHKRTGQKFLIPSGN